MTLVDNSGFVALLKDKEIFCGTFGTYSDRRSEIQRFD